VIVTRIFLAAFYWCLGAKILPGKLAAHTDNRKPKNLQTQYSRKKTTQCAQRRWG